AGPVGNRGRKLFANLREQIEIKPFAPGFADDVFVVLPTPIAVGPDVFVAAVPDRQRWMMGQASDIVAGLGFDLVSQGFFGIHRAGEEKILPDEDAKFVADVVEIIRLKNAAAPNAEHVAAGVDGLLNALANARWLAGSVEEAVVGDPVETFAEDGFAVDFENKSAADVVGRGI